MTDAGASAAIQTLDGQEGMDGRALKVSEAKPRAPRGGGGGHRDNRWVSQYQPGPVSA